MSRLVGEHAARLVERQVKAYGVLQHAGQSAAPAGPAPKAALTPPAPPYVTVSRQYGASGPVIARAVAERLGWSLYDRELLEEIARDAHLQGRLLEPFDEHARDTMEHWIRGLLTADTVSEHHYTASLFRVLASLAKVGHAVIVGRGAHLALPPEHGLRVRLYAPLEARVEAIMQEEALSAGEARKRLERVEQTREEWLHRAYGARAREWFTFDLALNTASLPVDGCVDLILKALELRQSVNDG